MNWLKILVAFAAFAIAGCAAYFSVTGLGVLFSGASAAVMIMASSLELAKLVAATYLKQKWNEIHGFNKWYLTISVGVLMLITSAGIFGYLSNAFQAQSLKLQVVDREILVYQTKIDQNTEQINQLNNQLANLSTTQNTILEKGNVNSRLLRSVDARDKQVAKLNSKINELQSDNVINTEKINQIKLSNLDLEKEVGGFRFVADAFGLELKDVVKFFIILIVIVFDPLAVALIIALNGLITTKRNMYGEPAPVKNYELYEANNDSTKLKQTETELIEEIKEETKIEAEIQPDTDENDGHWLNSYNGAPYYTNPNFPWEKKHLWQNDQKAVRYWLNEKGS